MKKNIAYVFGISKMGKGHDEDFLRILERRPLVLPSVFASFGVLLGHMSWDKSSCVVIFFGIYFLALYFALGKQIANRRFMLKFTILSFVSVLFFFHSFSIWEAHRELEDELYRPTRIEENFLVVSINDKKSEDGRTKKELTLKGLSGELTRGRLCIMHLDPSQMNMSRSIKRKDKKTKFDGNDQTTMEIGSVIRIVGTGESLRTGVNPGVYHHALRCYSKGIWMGIAPSKIGQGDFKIDPFRRFYYGLKRQLLQIRLDFEKELGKSKEAGLVKGMLFGNKVDIGASDREEFAYTGSAHLLAISGTHMAIIYGLGMFLAKRLGKRGRILVWFFLLFYALMTDWQTSVTRAFVLISLSLFGIRKNRKPDLINLLACLNIVFLLANPLVMWDVGYILSVLGVIGLGVVYPRLSMKVPKLLSLPLSLWIVMMPLQLYLFNLVTLLPLFAGVIIMFQGTILIGTSMGAFLIWMIGKGLGLSIFVSLPSLAIAKGVIFTNHLFSRLDFLYSEAASPPLSIVFVVTILVLVVFSEQWQIAKVVKLWKYQLAVVLTIVFLFTSIEIACGFRGIDQSRIVFLDVGQGSSLFVKDWERAFLIDGGGQRNFNIGERVLKPFLLKNGENNIDFAFATHLHMDHFKGFQELEKVFPVQKLVTRAEAGEGFVIGENIKIRILWPISWDEKARKQDENKNSIVYKITYYNTKILVLGDMTAEGEEELLKIYNNDDLSTDILAVSHHGSKYSTTDAFVKATKPKISVVSVGRKNRYGHPADEVIDRLKRYGSQVYRTDQHGGVEIDIDRDEYKVEPALL